MDNIQTNDDIVRGTNDDATVSRLSAASLNYIQDPFVQFFVKKPIRRSPIINRGTFIRCFALDSIVSQFLALPGPKKQIVALGAGFDTRYFNIKAGHLGETLFDRLERYYEVDFPEITMKKAMSIKRRKQLDTLVDHTEIERGGMDFKSDHYCLLGGDLRDWQDVSKRLIKAGLNVELPTLFLSECVFIYLSPSDSSHILQWITDHMKNAMFALYEQIKPDDAFGKMMIRNLKSRDIDLKGIHAFPDLIHQEKRFKDLGWQSAKAVDINTIHDTCLNQSEITRIAKLEILDELEEWRLLSAHYCVAWAIHSVDYESEFSHIGLQLSP
ncbi:S-adenosyl-L-methionine-dependent methyltransferase [Gilbertella persicaria]|uniref:S-adenosyl-L-methionine-dependent methyltransferase n=1 Tax=Gilbertella persicaria TaxID=101096 RepID=UPI00221FE305|nr:S-adenosyl-L-methionine-dependent methyltransferase [Gilbertella persicaria]KAI8053152.1 S-adenosyl-L-methionine-dependent methyltransferase [Gilbertella persicaria]